MESATKAPQALRSVSGVRQRIKRVAILGAGTTGSQIAALLASQGIPCDLLDLRPSDGKPNQLAEQALKRLQSLKPPPCYTPEALTLIRPGNFSDDLPRLKDADWVIEAVAEKLEIKKQLWAQAAQFVKEEAFISSNTSGIPIASLAGALPQRLRSRLIGTHFFNPPRYLRLLEIIPTPQTDPEVIAVLSQFAENVLGKGVVIAHDVPNFIANRIGAYGLAVTLKAMEEFKLGPDEVDSVTGPAMGRPGSATFRTLDLVGLDVFIDICNNLGVLLKDPAEREEFVVPPYLQKTVERRWLGEKTGQGFYKRVQTGGDTQILTLQTDTLEYRPRRRLQVASLAAVGGIEDPAERLRTLVNADDVAGRLAWRILSKTLAYAAQKVGEVADDVVGVDRAMRWGFGWELGPFEAWDALGMGKTTQRMRSDGLKLPDWVTKLAETSQTFYRHEAGGSLQATPNATFAPVVVGERVIPFVWLKAGNRQVAQRPGATLYDIGEGVAFLDFHSPKQALGTDMVEMLEESAQRVPRDFRGLVISSHVQPDFCFGANLMLVLMAAQEGEWDEIQGIVRRFQHALLRLKRMAVPVVAAPYGRTLGGGVEIPLSAHRVVASAELYMGMVEAGAGVLPAGGGCKEMLTRALEGLPGGLGAFTEVKKGGPPSIVPEPDPTPGVAKAFETIATARVSGSAAEALSIGFLRSSDVIVPNPDQLLYVARQTAIALDTLGHAPPAAVRLPVLGKDVRAVLEIAAQHLVWGNYASEHDLKIAKKIAYVITGGDRPGGSIADEEYFLDLEVEAFMSLVGEPKTQARMQHLLQKGTPLRN